MEPSAISTRSQRVDVPSPQCCRFGDPVSTEVEIWGDPQTCREASYVELLPEGVRTTVSIKGQAGVSRGMPPRQMACVGMCQWALYEVPCLICYGRSVFVFGRSLGESIKACGSPGLEAK